MMRCVVCHLLVYFLSCENERSGKCGDEINYEASHVVVKKPGFFLQQDYRIRPRKCLTEAWVMVGIECTVRGEERRRWNVTTVFDPEPGLVMSR